MQGPEPFHQFTVSTKKLPKLKNASKQTIYNLPLKTKQKNTKNLQYIPRFP